MRGPPGRKPPRLTPRPPPPMHFSMLRLDRVTLTRHLCLATVLACASSVPPARDATSHSEQAAPAASTEAASTEVTAPEEAPAPPAPPEDDGDPEAEEAYDYMQESMGDVSFELDAAEVESVLG